MAGSGENHRSPTVLSWARTRVCWLDKQLGNDENRTHMFRVNCAHYCPPRFYLHSVNFLRILQIAQGPEGPRFFLPRLLVKQQSPRALLTDITAHSASLFKKMYSLNNQIEMKFCN